MYLVCLVVVLRVVLEDLWPLLVIKGAHQLLDAHVCIRCPPLLAVDEPAQLSITPALFSIAVHTHICLASSTLNFLARRNRSCRCISQVSSLLLFPTHHCQGIQILGVSSRLQHGPELVDLGILLWRRVAGVAVLRRRCSGGVVVVVVLGVERELFGAGSSHGR